MGNNKKNKRGARGSCEEETGTPKRPNMAATAEPISSELASLAGPTLMEEIPGQKESSIAPVEPSLIELREMLVDIKIDICNILRENEAMKNNMDELKATIRGQNVEIANLRASLNKAIKQFDDAEQELAETRKIVDQQEEEIAELYDLQDHLEQYTRKNSLEIHGTPEQAYESTEEVVLKLANALEVPVCQQDIEISHKLSRRKGFKPIIVKFVNHKTKTNLYKARTKLKNVSFSSLFPASTAAARVASGKIYLFESLTSYRKKIVNKANEMRNDGSILSVWTMDGKIFIKTSPEGRPIKINELDDLDYL